MFWNRKLVAAGFTICVSVAISLIAIFLVAVFAMGFAGTSFAQQFDAPYYELQKKHAAKWAKEDKTINAKRKTHEKPRNQ